MHAPQPITSFERYSTPAQLFHWLTALLVIVAYIVSPGFRRRGRSAFGLPIFMAGSATCLFGWRVSTPPPRFFTTSGAATRFSYPCCRVGERPGPLKRRPTTAPICETDSAPHAKLISAMIAA
jgi:hypothetical protein